jgi:hypothetical protein
MASDISSGRRALTPPDQIAESRAEGLSLIGVGAEISDGLCADQLDDKSRHAGFLQRRLRASENHALPGQHAAIRNFCTNAVEIAKRVVHASTLGTTRARLKLR